MMITAKGNTCVKPGDHMYVLACKDDQAYLRLIMGAPEE